MGVMAALKGKVRVGVAAAPALLNRSAEASTEFKRKKRAMVFLQGQGQSEIVSVWLE
ncbi:hypothetical protein GCM10008939_34040 [Deinococcus aquiradiocola]|uniref:Uncharacterized protein n=1 Tax=Deinococcus aquiradiocola TaxID=393059 RepID=A0A917UV88_9DEIO|nr:hypothetical protein GCM10008939_34040 [Deinococcus aquiradiocola]